MPDRARAERGLARLRALFALRKPVAGSLGPPFAIALAAGTTLAVLAGRRYVTPIDSPPWLLLSLSLWQPLTEELLFRGIVQTELRRIGVLLRTHLGLTRANALTSAAFAALHLVHQSPAWALGTFFPSLVFGYFRDRSDSVWPAVALHCAYNAGFFLSQH